jgi:hypothetical protein
LPAELQQIIGGAPLFCYGKTNALQAFPLNSLFTTLTANLNNASINCPSQDVLPALLKMFNYEELAKYNSLTPSLVDSFYQDYADGVGSNNSVLGNYAVGGFAKEYQPRGCFVVTLNSQADGKGVNIPLAFSASPATPAQGQVPANAGGTSPYASVYLTVTVTEPLIGLSPFITGHSNNVAGFLGLNTLTMAITFGNANRCMSNASISFLADGVTPFRTIDTVSVVGVTDNKLLFNFVAIPPMLMAKIEPRNVLTYTNYMPLSSNSVTLGAKGSDTVSQLVNSNSFQLGQVPSKMMIYAKKMNANTYDSNFYDLRK